MKKYFFLSLLFLFIPSGLCSQSIDHPIDVFLDSCMEKYNYTDGVVKCTEEAMEMWNFELNKNYELLSGLLDSDALDALSSSQKEWLKFKKREFESIDLIYSRLDGTMYIPMHAYSKLEVIKTRALKLKNFYLLLSGK